MLGCGYNEEYKGKGKLTKEDFKGICPGWWRNQIFSVDALRYIRLSEKIEINPLTPRRLVNVLYYYGVFKALMHKEEG